MKHLNDRSKEIYEKGFNMTNAGPSIDYSKIKVGVKSLEDATLNLGSLKTMAN